MIEVIYYEEGIANHPRTLRVLEHFTKIQAIPCSHYKEVFNPSGQNFRLQKKKPSLILARKTGSLVLPVPNSYGVGGQRNFYFSHMLNCLYDCRYCFLQGLYPSANYVLFINYEDFFEEMDRLSMECEESETWFFSGYDCDSLAMEKLTGFVGESLPFFAAHPNAFLELRTKSCVIRPLEQAQPLPNVVIAFSFTPQEISRQLEHRVPPISQRLKAIKKLVQLGWPIGLRFDPLIHCVDFKKRYQTLFEKILGSISEDAIHSISIGSFRAPKPFFKKMQKLYPEELLFSGDFHKRGKSYGYSKEIESSLIDSCTAMLKSLVSESKIFFCTNESVSDL